MENWEATLEFKIYSEGEPLVGDGFALWFDESPKYTPGPAMGKSQRWHGLGVFVDIFNNNLEERFENQQIAGFVSKGDLEYNKGLDGVGQHIGKCKANVVGRSNNSKLRVSYSNVTGVIVSLLEDASDENSNGSADTKGHGESLEWRECFRAPDVRISPNSHIGVTGNTGMLAAVQELHGLHIVRRDGSIGVEGKPLHNKVDYDSEMFESGNKDRWGDSEDDLSTGMSFGRMLLVIVVCCVILYAVYSVYRIKMQRDLRRF